MKFEIVPKNNQIEIGDVFPGRQDGAVYWVVFGVGISEWTAIGLNNNGKVLLVRNLAADYFRDLRPIGRCPELANLTLTIEMG